MAKRKHPAYHYVVSILMQVWTHASNRHRRVRAVMRALTWQVYKRVLPRRPRVVDFFGLRLVCHPDSTAASNVFYFTERYDPDEMDFMCAYLREGEGFVDVGANIGTYCLLASTVVGPRGRIVAFEPDRLNARRLQENVAENGLGNVDLIEAAVAESEGRALFTAGWDVSNQIVTGANVEQDAVEVRTVSLDDALGDGAFAMGKIDVEGFETAAFRGARHRLAAADPPVWQIEILDHQLGKAGSSRDELTALLDEAGFMLASFDRERGVVEYMEAAEVSPGNVLAIHRSARAHIERRLSEAATGCADGVAASRGPTRRSPRGARGLRGSPASGGQPLRA